MPLNYCKMIRVSISCSQVGEWVSNASKQGRTRHTSRTLPWSIGSEERLEEFLSAADIWIIPYRKNVAGVSVPSRFYNLLAIGRPVLIISEADAEAALTVSENRLGWVVTPGDACELAKTIRFASSYEEIKLNSVRAAAMAARFNEGSWQSTRVWSRRF
jgi:glycosyltransferase involved in cell wall biosynthesis